MDKTTISQTRVLHKALKTLSSEHNDLSVTTVMCLLEVALNEGLTIKELSDSLEMTHSVASYNVAILTERGSKRKKGSEGLDLVKREEHPEDTRAKVLTLTSKGKNLIGRIVKRI